MIGPFGEDRTHDALEAIPKYWGKKNGCRELTALEFNQHLNCVQYKARDMIVYAGKNP